MNTGLIWTKDVNNYTPKSDNLVELVGSTKSTISDIRVKSVSEDEQQQSTAYINAGGELRSLPNGTYDEICDEVNIVDGIKTQRVGVKANIISGTVIDFTDMATDGVFVAYDADDMPYQVGVKGDTLTADATSLTYQLQQELVTPIDVDGELQCFENGSIHIEPYIKKEFTYNDGITFTYPVSQIDKIKMNVNGELKEITNTVTLAQDGLSATVANITNGTVLTVYAPIKPEYSTIPTTVIQYPTNTKSVIYGTHALANKNAVILDDHESMLLGLSLNYIDLVNKVSDLETRVATLEEPEIPEG